MARRSTSTTRTEESTDETETPASTRRPGVWERRRRRLEKKKEASSTPRSSTKPKPAEDVDPYDSDPGESYRDHCLRLKGVGTRSCVPNFLLRKEEETILTAPPSPLASELGDLLQAPASLSSAKIRYSLRSSITDGAEKQPSGPSVMERRELRPNQVHLNVSHWSDAGGRPYMEDR